MKRILLSIWCLLLLSGVFLPHLALAVDKYGGTCICTLSKSCVACVTKESTVELDDTHDTFDEASCTTECTAYADEISGYDVSSSLTYHYDVTSVNYTPAAVPINAAAPPPTFVVPDLSIKIPGISFNEPSQVGGNIIVDFLPQYIAGVYRYALGLAAFFAIVMIMVGGVQYMMGSATGGEAVGAAKTRITNAVTGLILVLAAYTVLYVINPDLTSLESLQIQFVPAIPSENIIDLSDADSTSSTCTGDDCKGVNKWQDCMLEQYGASDAEVQTHLTTVKLEYGGYSRSYKVHKKAASSFEAAFAEIAASGITYNFIDDGGSGGTQNWRANKNRPTVLSNHSWGTAIDMMPTTNPNCPRACLDGVSTTACKCIGGPNCETICASGKGDLPKEIIDAFKNHGFTWLGDTQAGHLKDFMHFDFSTGCP